MRPFVSNSHLHFQNSNAKNRSLTLACSQCLISCEPLHVKSIIVSMADVKVEWSTELVEMLMEDFCLNQIVWDLGHPSYKIKNAQEAA